MNRPIVTYSKHTRTRRSHRNLRGTSSSSTIAAVIALSIAAHVIALYTAEQTGLLRSANALSIGEREAKPVVNSTRPTATPSPTCEANIAIGTAARLLVCTSPVMKRGECLRAALDRLSLGFTICNAVAMSSDVALITPEVVEQIEAEPLLELLEPETQQAIEEQAPKLAELLEQSSAQPKPPPPPPPPTKTQVVEITQPTSDKRPDVARFMSDFNSTVEKETVARGSTEEMIERPQARELKAKDNPREASIAEIPEQARAPDKNPDAPAGAGALTMRAPGESREAQEAKEAETAGDLAGKKSPEAGAALEVARGTSDSTQEAQEASEGKTGEGGGGGGRPRLPNLAPTADVLERALGGGSVDKLENVASGDKTALNTQQWKYASFFNRMKRRVAQHWHPNEVFLRADPHGNVYGFKDRVTVLQITLDRTGAIRHLMAKKKSGADELDEEAMRAFRLAQPFPNPPAGLVDPRSGFIVFEFGFHFDVKRRSHRRIFRYRRD